MRGWWTGWNGSEIGRKLTWRWKIKTYTDSPWRKSSGRSSKSSSFINARSCGRRSGDPSVGVGTWHLMVFWPPKRISRPPLQRSDKRVLLSDGVAVLRLMAAVGSVVDCMKTMSLESCWKKKGQKMNVRVGLAKIRSLNKEVERNETRNIPKFKNNVDWHQSKYSGIVKDYLWRERLVVGKCYSVGLVFKWVG